MGKFICGTDEQENNRQGMEDYEEIHACVNDDPEAIKWLEEHKDLYFTEEN